MKRGKRLTVGEGSDKGVGRCDGCGLHDIVKEFEVGGLLCPVCEAEHERFYGVMNIVISYLEDLIERGIARESDIRSLRSFLPKRLV